LRGGHGGLQNRAGQFRQHRKHNECQVAVPRISSSMSGSAEATAYVARGTFDMLYRTLRSSHPT
jgi:hypothetical protein